MIPVHSTEEIFGLMQNVKENAPAFITNFFIDTEKLNWWLSEYRIFLHETAHGVLLFRKNTSFYHLYYISSSPGNLEALLSDLPTEVMVTDIIDAEEKIHTITNLFTSKGFKKYAQLQRCLRINNINSEYYNKHNGVVFADNKDAPAIAKLFRKNFDPFSEQVPGLQEVRILIEEKKIIQIKEQGIIKGFLVRTFNGQTSILNSFLVDKPFRGEKIGSRLLQHYISESRNTKRMILWALANNEIALNIYKRYGYAQDSLVDFILIKNYNGKNS